MEEGRLAGEKGRSAVGGRRVAGGGEGVEVEAGVGEVEADGERGSGRNGGASETGGGAVVGRMKGKILAGGKAESGGEGNRGAGKRVGSRCERVGGPGGKGGEGRAKWTWGAGAVKLIGAVKVLSVLDRLEPQKLGRDVGNAGTVEVVRVEGRGWEGR